MKHSTFAIVLAAIGCAVIYPFAYWIGLNHRAATAVTVIFALAYLSVALTVIKHVTAQRAARPQGEPKP